MYYKLVIHRGSKVEYCQLFIYESKSRMCINPKQKMSVYDSSNLSYRMGHKHGKREIADIIIII